MAETPAVPAVTFTTPPAAAPAAPVVPQAPAASAPTELDESTLDEHSQKVVAAIRDDFKAERTKRQAAESALAAATTTATDARNEFAQTIGKALGLIKDDESVDPAKLAEQLITSGAETRTAQVALAVYKAAGTIADPGALLDSTSFLVSLKDIDPTDSAAVTAAITKAVESNPRLGAVMVAPGMKPNPAQGRSASAPLGIAEQIAASEKAGDTKATIRLKAAMGLNNSN